LHDRNVGEKLGHGTDAVDSLSGGWDFSLGIGETKAFGPYNLLIVNQRD
jgi:hypothetical protein